MLIEKTDLLDDDPVLWFTLMLMPTGPTAMKLMAMAEVDDAEEEDKMSISRVLMVRVKLYYQARDYANRLSQSSYLVSPLLSLTVVGSLKACTWKLDK